MSREDSNIQNERERKKKRQEEKNGAAELALQSLAGEERR